MQALAAIVKPLRSFLFRTPDEYGMQYEELTIPSADDTPLEAWYIPAQAPSNKLVIFNHALPMCRAGFPGHFGMPWAGFDAVEIDFVKQYEHLTRAGYNVLTYDFRNHGNSGAANNSVCGIGNWKWRDCVGVKEYVDAHPKLGKMDVALYSQCLGGISQYRAMKERPELFENVKCMVSPLVPNMSAIFSRFAENAGVLEYLPLLDLELLKMGGFTAEEMGGAQWAPYVKVPTFMFQVRDDEWMRNPEDAQYTFDKLGSQEKELYFIEGTTKRFRDGYNWFGREPQRVLDFLAKYMQ